jgi:release factor glutamine methyltransferase
LIPLARTRFGSLRLLTPPRVYAPRADTKLLAGEIGAVEQADVLELCAGCGAVALTAAARGARRVVAGDRSRAAVLSIRVNARLNGLRVDARRGDLFAVAQADERFDLILANPPYLPRAGARAGDRRWDAGADGRQVLDRIIDGVPPRLKPSGRLVLVQSALAGIDATRERLAANQLEVVRSIEHEGPLGPIAMARRDALVQIGALAPQSTRETLIVLTAQHACAVMRQGAPATSAHPGAPATRQGSRGSSGFTAGPSSTLPSTAKREPWHGQSHERSAALKRKRQPMWVQRSETP